MPELVPFIYNELEWWPLKDISEVRSTYDIGVLCVLAYLRKAWQCDRRQNSGSVFTARCTLMQSVVLRSHVVCLSVCLSVTLVDCDHIGWNSSKIISPLVSLGRSLFATPTWRVCSKGNTPKFGPKVTHPLLIWASETFDRKLRPNGYR